MTPDPLQRAAGRGAYACPRRRCLDLAVRRRRFVRVLGASVEDGTGEQLAHATVEALLQASRELVARGVQDGRARRLTVGEAIPGTAGAVVPGDMAGDGELVVANDERLSGQLGTLMEQVAALREEIEWPLRRGTLK